MSEATSLAPWGPLDTVAVENIGWTSGVPYMTYVERRNMQSGVLNSRQIVSKHVTATNLPDTVRSILYYYSATETDTLDQMTSFIYDSYNNPITAIARHKTYPSSAVYDSLDDIQHFYYELFTRDNTGVVNAKTDGLKIYPNPTRDELFISQGASTVTLSKITVYDITGRLVINVDAATSGSTSIITHNLPQGVYIVLLQGAGGNILQREKVVKQ